MKWHWNVRPNGFPCKLRYPKHVVGHRIWPTSGCSQRSWPRLKSNLTWCLLWMSWQPKSNWSLILSGKHVSWIPSPSICRWIFCSLLSCTCYHVRSCQCADVTGVKFTIISEAQNMHRSLCRYTNAPLFVDNIARLLCHCWCKSVSGIPLFEVKTTVDHCMPLYAKVNDLLKQAKQHCASCVSNLCTVIPASMKVHDA